MKAQTPDAPLDPETQRELAQAIAPVELSIEERDRMRARILKRVQAPPPPGMLTLRASDGTWEEFAKGVHIKVLRDERSAGMLTYLVRMAPGAVAPRHSHTQEEHCLVLEGEVVMGDHVIRTGDWHVALPGSTHESFATKTGCLVLIRSENPSAV
jgi:quercetin dioxygenase-like cupin family protein